MAQNTFQQFVRPYPPSYFDATNEANERNPTKQQSVRAIADLIKNGESPGGTLIQIYSDAALEAGATRQEVESAKTCATMGDELHPPPRRNANNTPLCQSQRRDGTDCPELATVSINSAYHCVAHGYELYKRRSRFRARFAEQRSDAQSIDSPELEPNQPSQLSNDHPAPGTGGEGDTE